MFQDDTLDNVYDHLAEKNLQGAVNQMEEYLALHPHQINSDRLYAIKADYQMMIDYWRKGFKDSQLPQLYQKLLHRMYVLYANIITNARVLNSPILSSLMMKARLSTRDWSIQVIREQLESFVSDVAMLGLEPQHTVQEHRKQVYLQHNQLICEFFAHIMTADLWTDGQGEAMKQLLLSPTIDSADQQLIISAMMLATMNCFDIVKYRTMVQVYLNATDEYVRQRALVGWVFSIDLELANKLYPEANQLVKQVLTSTDNVKELVELQKQLFYCKSAEEDRDTIQNEIMPDLLKGQNIQNMRAEFMEQDEDSVLNDILNPDAEEEKLEKMEAGFHRMINMQKQGSDIYFGGFSQMKRFSFFNEIANWFVPYYIDHPGIAKAKEKFADVEFLKVILERGPFCNSDKYSFMLAFDSVLNQIPEHMRGMLDKGEAAIVQKLDAAEMNTPTYIRRIYLQDLYRFFRLHPARGEFDDIFADDACYSCLFLKQPVYKDTAICDYYKDVATFLAKRNRYDEAAFLLKGLKDENKRDYDYYMLMACLDERPEENYQRALTLKPKDERALMGLAKTLFKNYKFEKALDAYNQLLELSPDKLSYLIHKAVCLTNLHRYAEAEQILFKLNYEDPDNLNVARVLAWALTGNGKYEPAGRLFEQLVDGEQPSANDFVNYGFYLWLTGQLDEAASCFRSSVDYAEDIEDEQDYFHQIIFNEHSLLHAKGITDEEMQMMVDMICA